jgi:FkbM family methyltransferase
MNNGDDTDFYLSKAFRVVAVEANPDLCVLAKQRFASEIRNGRLHIVNKAISETTGQIELFINDQVTGWSTIDSHYLQGRNQEGTKSCSFMVPAATFQEILREYGVPYYVKADIQGAELFCLEALLEFEDRPRSISISSGSEAAGGRALKLIGRAFDLFSRLGYHRFKIIPQQYTDLEKCPFPAREGS